MTAAPSPGPLDGIRVVELTALLAGPSAAMTLADLGADVVKIEPPAGDAGRTLGTDGSLFASVNRNKRSIALDLKSEPGATEAFELMAASDVVIQALRPGAADRLGLGPRRVRDGNPRLIYASLSAFGADGPDGHRGGLDNLMQAESGMMHLNGYDGSAPLKCGFMVVDMTAGMALAQAVLAALYDRERSGVGATIEVRLLDCALYLQTAQLAEFSVTGRQPPRTGNAAGHAAPSDMIRTSDGHIVLAAYLPHQWERLCLVLECEWMITDDRFATMEDRRQHRADLVAALEEIFITRTSAEWADILRQGEVLFGRVRAYVDVIEDPQVNLNGTLLDVTLPSGASARVPRPPYTIQGWEPEVRLPPPSLDDAAHPGEHVQWIERSSRG